MSPHLLFNQSGELADKQPILNSQYKHHYCVFYSLISFVCFSLERIGQIWCNIIYFFCSFISIEVGFLTSFMKLASISFKITYWPVMIYQFNVPDYLASHHAKFDNRSICQCAARIGLFLLSTKGWMMNSSSASPWPALWGPLPWKVPGSILLGSFAAPPKTDALWTRRGNVTRWRRLRAKKVSGVGGSEYEIPSALSLCSKGFRTWTDSGHCSPSAAYKGRGAALKQSAQGFKQRHLKPPTCLYSGWGRCWNNIRNVVLKQWE